MYDIMMYCNCILNNVLFREITTVTTGLPWDLILIPNGNATTANPLPSDIPVSHECFVFLGCSIGSPSFCLSFGHEKAKHLIS